MKKYLVAPVLYKKKNEIFQSVSLKLNKLLKEINIDFEYYIYGKKTRIKKFDGLILCGGGDIFAIKKNLLNKLRDNEEKKLIKLFLLKKKKILSICRGFQLISQIYGSKLIKISNHVNKKSNVYIYKNKYLDVKKINVTCYHNYGIKNLSKEFSIMGKTKDNNIELAIHQKNKILGTMFHPERKNVSDKIIKKMLKDFL